MTQKIKLLSLIGVAILGCGSAAIAGDEEATTYEKPFNSGAYADLFFGYSFGKANLSESLTIAGFGFSPTATAKPSSNGVTEGIALGYRHVMGNGFLVGVEAIAAWNNNELHKFLVYDPAVPAVFASSTLTTRGQIIPALVLGKQINAKWLAFLKAGAAFNFFSLTHDAIIPGNTPSSGTFRYGTYGKTATGFMAAIGGEYALNKQVSFTGTVMYTGSGTIKQSYSGEQLNELHQYPIDSSASTKFKPYFVTATVGLKYKF